MQHFTSIGTGAAAAISMAILGSQAALGQDARLSDDLHKCREAGDMTCAHRVLREMLTAPAHVEWCKRGSPEAAEGCLMMTTWFFCSAEEAAAVEDSSGRREIARLGRQTVRDLPIVYGDGPPGPEYLILADSLFDLIEAEACRDDGDRVCLETAARKVALADEVGAYQKSGLRQCWPATGGVPRQRITAVLEAAGKD